MSIVKCDYYDKLKNPMTSLGDLNVRRIDLALALLILHGQIGTLNTIRLFASYLLVVFSDFSFKGGDLKFIANLSSCYDGLKRQKSEIYAAMMTVIVAFNKYNQDNVYPYDAVVLNSGKSTRPDFVGKKGNTFSLFEAKGSIGKVSPDKIKKSIVQVSAIPNLNLIGIGNTTISNRYSVICNLNHNSGNNIDLRIYDPDNSDDVYIEYNLEQVEQLFYDYVVDLIRSGDGVREYMFEGRIIKGTEINVGEKDKLILGIVEEKYPLIHSECEIRKSNLKNLNLLQNKEEKLMSDGIYICLTNN